MERMNTSSEIASCSTQSDFTNATGAFGTTSPPINPCHSFGVCKEVNNNLVFTDEETVIFPSGKHCVFYSIAERSISFLPGLKTSKGIQAMALSPDQRYLAVSESSKCCTISIFDLKDENFKKRQVLNVNDYGVQNFVCMAFSADSKYLLGQAKGLAWTLYYWKWKTKELIHTVKTTKNGVVSQVSFNPQDETQICVSGNGVFKIFELQKDTLKEASSYKSEKDNVICHAWMSKDCIVGGTEGGKLLMLKAGRMYTLGRPHERKTDKSDSSSSPDLPSVTTITQYSKGFACSAGPGLVCLYEKIKEKDNYRKTVEITIPVVPGSTQPLQTIATMCISPAEETLAVSTDRGQLYYINLTSAARSAKAQFEFLFHSVHSEHITSLSVCPSKPLIATCSKDCTVHIWNYKTKSLEQFKEFEEEPLCVSIHPNGHSILVGFSTEVCLMNLLNNDMCTVQSFYMENCLECVFNHDGHLFAAINKNVVEIYNIRTREKLDLTGHQNEMQSLKWSSDDRQLLSCGMDNGVCFWNAVIGKYEMKCQSKFRFADVMFSPNNKSVLAVGSVGLKEIGDGGMVLWDMPSDNVEYTAMSMTHSAQKLFIGTAAGTVRVMKYPFEKNTNWTEHHAHCGPITKMAVTPDDQFLLTASKDGSLFIWTIPEQEGQRLTMLTEIDHPEEVLCTKAYLAEQDQIIHELRSRINWLMEKNEYNVKLNDVDCSTKIENIKQCYDLQLQAQKDQIRMLNTKMEELKASHQKEMAELKEKDTNELKDLERSYLQMISVEHERYYEMEQKMKTMLQEQEKKLEMIVDSHIKATKEKKQDYEAQIHELQAKLEQQVKSSEEKVMQIKGNAESELMELCRDYEQDLQVEREINRKVHRDMKLMEKNISQFGKMTQEMKEQDFKIFTLEDQVQRLRGKLQDMANCKEELTKDKEEQSKTIDDQKFYIEQLHEIIKQQKETLKQTQDELSKMTFESKKNEEESQLRSSKDRSEFERMQRELEDNKETFREIALNRARLKEENHIIVVDLKQKLKSTGKALLTERQKVINVNHLVQKMKADIHNCANFIQEPKLLKEHFVKMHKRYVHDPCVEVEDDFTKDSIQTLENILAHERSRHARELSIEKGKSLRLFKEGAYLIEQLKEHKIKHQELMIDLKKRNIECDNTISSEIIVDENGYKPLLPLHQPEKQNKRLDKRLAEILSPQCSSGFIKFPPINTTKRTT